MNVYVLRFNTVLMLVLLVLSAGCQGLRKKDAATLRLYMETSSHDPSKEVQEVEIGQDGILSVRVEKEPFLDEGDVAQASIVKAVGGYQLMIQFNRKGSWTLEAFTTANRGKRMAILSQFGEVRWLAAPSITRTIKDGTLVFTPDATREEAERIARGLNAVAKVAQKNNP